jgi:hypothetical protein
MKTEEKIEEFFRERKNGLDQKFEWSQENREKIVEISNDFMREFMFAFDEAKKQAEFLEKRIADDDPYVNDYEIEIVLSFNYWDIFENHDEDDFDLDLFLSNHCDIKYNYGGHHNRNLEGHDYPLYINQKLNWNIEIFPKDWDENMYVSYAVHQLVCDGILSFQDFLKISRIFSEVVVRIQKNTV